MVLSCLYVNRSDRIHNETKPIQWSLVFEMKRQNQNRKFTGLKLKKSSKKKQQQQKSNNFATHLYTHTQTHWFGWEIVIFVSFNWTEENVAHQIRNCVDRQECSVQSIYV